MVGTQISAQELFRAAYENRYTWDKSFPGYTAEVTYHRNSDIFTGQAKVGADFKPEVTGIDDEAAQKEIHGQLFEIAIHRVRRSFEDTHSKNSFSYGKTLADGSVEVLMGGKSEGDRYELRNNEVSMVHAISTASSSRSIPLAAMIRAKATSPIATTRSIMTPPLAKPKGA